MDSDGNPKIVYHATDAAFTVFDRDKLGGDSHTVWIPFTSEQIKDASPVTYDDAGKVIPLSKRFDTTQQDIRYSPRENDHLLSKSEYARFMSNWNSQKYGNQFEPRPNGGKMIVMDNIIVYTDHTGNVERVLEVTTGDIWKLNDIQQQMMLIEESGEDYEVQRTVLQSVYGEESAHFRTKGERTQTSGKNRKGTGRNARSVGKGDSEEVSSQKARGTLGVLNSEDKYSLRPQTDTPEFQRWFKDSEVVDSDGNPKIVYHATDAAFTVFDRDKLGGDSHTVWIPFTSEQIKDASPVTYDDAGKVIPLSERFDTTQQDIRYSPRENDHLLSKSEYARFMSNWNSQKYGNQFEPRPNGGKMIVMDNIIVYTDHKDNVERVLEVTTGDIWKLNDIQQTMMILEEDGVDHEIQQIVLHSVYDTESAHFRTGGERSSIGRQNRKGTGRNARSVGKGDSGEVSSQKERGTLASVNHKAQAKFALRDQTETKQFKRWFGDSEVVDSDGNPKIVYHATDAAFTVFDRNKLGSDSHTVWIPFTSEQIKNASPVTYDDAGKVIPLSERFDTTQQDIRYSVRELDDGRKYVEVDTDQHIFDGVPASEYKNIAERYLVEHFRGKVAGNINRAYVDRRATKEYVHPARKNLDAHIYNGKMKASTELDNIFGCGYIYWAST